MSNKTSISWCDSTVNFWSGCTKVSPGCAHCYAEARDARMMQEKVSHWGKGAKRLKHVGAVRQAVAMNRKPFISECCGRSFDPRKHIASEGGKCCPFCSTESDHYPVHRRRIFSLSLGDIGDAEVPMEWFNEAMVTIDKCRNVVWILCTKRPADFLSRWLSVCEHWGRTNTALPKNVIMLTSVENQEMANLRIPELLKIPAVCHGLSLEPLLGPVALESMTLNWGGKLTRPVLFDLDWLIIGGESGPSARACNVDWIRSIVASQRSTNVKVFVKQLGALPQLGREDHQIIRDKKGGDINEWPQDLRLQQWPEL